MQSIEQSDVLQMSFTDDMGSMEYIRYFGMITHSDLQHTFCKSILTGARVSDIEVWLFSVSYREDILPCRVYLRHCVLAAKALSPEVYDNFLHCSYLGDKKTTIGEYLKTNPSIMDELPPEELVDRYSG